MHAMALSILQPRRVKLPVTKHNENYQHKIEKITEKIITINMETWKAEFLQKTRNT